MTKNKQDVVASLRGGLIVSCQAEPKKGSQLYEPRDIARMAKEVLQAGACAVRICGYEDIRETRNLNPNAMIIGITKSAYYDGRVLITPDIKSIDQIVDAGADIVAMDMTKRTRPSGITSLSLYLLAREKYPDVVFMADCSDFDECTLAINQGADLVGTTLSGYTSYTKNMLRRDKWHEYGPDFGLLNRLTKTFRDKPIIAEGRYRTPEQCNKAIHLFDAWAVCVGSQVTRPREIVRWHVQAVKGEWTK